MIRRTKNGSFDLRTKSGKQAQALKNELRFKFMIGVGIFVGILIIIDLLFGDKIDAMFGL